MITYELYYFDTFGQAELWSKHLSLKGVQKEIKESKKKGISLKDIMVFEGTWEDRYQNYRKTLDLELKDKGY